MTARIYKPAKTAMQSGNAKTRDWVLDYADERCTLLRVFGEGANETRLRLDSFGSWISFRFTVAGNAVPKRNGPTGEMKIRFAPDSEDRDISALHGMVGEVPAVFSPLS